MTNHNTHKNNVFVQKNTNYNFRWQPLIFKFKRKYITGFIKTMVNYDYLRRSMLFTTA